MALEAWGFLLWSHNLSLHFLSVALVAFSTAWNTRRADCRLRYLLCVGCRSDRERYDHFVDFSLASCSSFSHQSKWKQDWHLDLRQKYSQVLWGLIFISVRLFLPFIHSRALRTSSPTALLFWGYSDICLQIDKTPVAIPTLDHPPSFPSWPLKMSDETEGVFSPQLLHSALDAISGPRSEIRQHIHHLRFPVSALLSFHSLFFWLI